MKKIAWMTDIHLNFLRRPEVVKFCRDIAEMNPDAALLGGDIGDARTIKTYIDIFQDVLECPIYFVLGNHDFYHGAIAEVREQIKKFSAGSKLLHWLPEAGIVPLSARTCLLGCESWADGRLGDYAKSKVMLNDYFLIDEFTRLDSRERLKKLKSLADDAVAGMAELLPKALDRFQTVILLTHVPLFMEVCRYRGRNTNTEWLPHFSCKAAGDVIKKHMSNDPNREMLILCGHTHDAFQTRIRSNVEVRVGGAVYGAPRIQELLTEGFIDLSAADTKTSEPRRIYFNEALRTLFKELGKVRRIRSKAFFTYRGKPLVVIRKAFYEACAKASIRDFRIHDLRHTFNTNMRKAGVDRSVIMKITGHKTTAMFDRYNTVDSEDARVAMNRYEGFLRNQTTAILLQALPDAKKEGPAERPSP